MRSLNIAATGMLAQQLNVEVISNNIANLNTTAFKRQRAEFQDLLYQTERRVGATSSDTGTIVPVGVQIGSGVKAAAVYRMSDQGNLTNTNNPLDLAIQGQGYFQIQMPDGTTAYTRDGSLQLSPTGEIVTADGYVVAARHHAAEQHHRGHGQRERPGAGADRRPADAADGGPASARELSRTRPASQAHGRQLSDTRRRPRARRPSAIPAPPRSARSSRAISRPRTSTSSPRSPTSSPRSAPTR